MSELEYTFESFCLLNGLDYSEFEAPPISFSEWLGMNPNMSTGDFNPHVVYDGYCHDIESRGFEVYGDSTYGIGVKRMQNETNQMDNIQIKKGQTWQGTIFKDVEVKIILTSVRNNLVRAKVNRKKGSTIDYKYNTFCQYYKRVA